jgi:hypothetical protein
MVFQSGSHRSDINHKDSLDKSNNKIRSLLILSQEKVMALRSGGRHSDINHSALLDKFNKKVSLLKSLQEMKTVHLNGLYL